MSMISRFIGPESKYDNSLPYTYEARVPVIEGDDDYNSYISDTICGLIQYLQDKNINPDEATLYEIYKEDEKIIDTKPTIRTNIGPALKISFTESADHSYDSTW